MTTCMVCGEYDCDGKNHMKDAKPREWTFDEICESQDFNHEDLFVEYSALAEALAEIEHYRSELEAEKIGSKLRKESLISKSQAKMDLEAKLAAKDAELDQIRTEEKSMALTAARIQIAKLNSEMSALIAERDRWKTNAEKKANYINELLDINLKLEKECGREPGDY